MFLEDCPNADDEREQEESHCVDSDGIEEFVPLDVLVAADHDQQQDSAHQLADEHCHVDVGKSVVAAVEQPLTRTVLNPVHIAYLNKHVRRQGSVWP